jgi:O-6-methylguanine DNA methyltransferase
MRCSAGHSTGCDRDVRDHCGAGEPRAARAVGQALGRNPFPIIVPCHRVLAAGGRMGGFSANGGVATKLKLLAIEGAVLALADPPIARATRHA